LHLSVIVVATILWAAGSLAAKAMPLPASPWMSSAAQMLCGGVALTAVGFAFGERVEVEVITMQSWMAFIYLTMIGSIAGFGTYVFLLNNTTMARVSTYTFVNPIVAVALGYFIADEPIGPRTVMAGALIIIAVVLILYRAPVPTLRASVRQTA
jgi:drug/metabolite transporter (DMT)-like permease